MLIVGFVPPEKQAELQRLLASSPHGDLAIFSTLGGSDSSSKRSLASLGLTDEQIARVTEAFGDAASTMSVVGLDARIDTTSRDVAATGDLMLFTISGAVTSSKGTQDYRLIANKADADGADARLEVQDLWR